MRKIVVREISSEERLSLEKGAKHGATSDFRLRCQAVLLRTEVGTAESTASAVAARLGCCVASVNNWLKRYQAHGLAGLHIKKGRDASRSCSRKPILLSSAASSSVSTRYSLRQKWNSSRSWGRSSAS